MNPADKPLLPRGIHAAGRQTENKQEYRRAVAAVARDGGWGEGLSGEGTTEQRPVC